MYKRQGKAAPRPVEAGAWLGPDWIIKKGLSDGDTVILDNLLKLRPGAPVKPQASGGPGGAPGTAPGGAAPGAAPAAPAPGAAPAEAKKAG